MIHALTPDLGDPLLLAAATLPALQEVLAFDRGEAKLTYDPPLKNPIRIRPASGTTFDTDGARNRLADMIEPLRTAGAPFQDSFLKAGVRQPNGSASCREIFCQQVWLPGDPQTIKRKTTNNT